jgi:hypothetical protein
MTVYASICAYKIFWQNVHDPGFRTVNLMHIARLSRPLDHECWCSVCVYMVYRYCIGFRPARHLLADVGHPARAPQRPPRRPWRCRPGPPIGSPGCPFSHRGAVSRRRCGAVRWPGWKTCGGGKARQSTCSARTRSGSLRLVARCRTRQGLPRQSQWLELELTTWSQMPQQPAAVSWWRTAACVPPALFFSFARASRRYMVGVIKEFEWAGWPPGFKIVRTKKTEELFGQSMHTKVCLPSLERQIGFCSKLYWVIVFSSPFCF